jgi:hypothetical protein
MPSFKKLTCKGTLRQVFICQTPPPPLGWSINFVGSESGQIQSVKLLQNMVSNRIPYPIAHGIRMYSIQYLFTQGRGGGGGVELNQREGERGNRGEYRSQIWV